MISELPTFEQLCMFLDTCEVHVIPYTDGTVELAGVGGSFAWILFNPIAMAGIEAAITHHAAPLIRWLEAQGVKPWDRNAVIEPASGAACDDPFLPDFPELVAEERERAASPALPGGIVIDLQERRAARC